MVSVPISTFFFLFFENFTVYSVFLFFFCLLIFLFVLTSKNWSFLFVNASIFFNFIYFLIVILLIGFSYLFYLKNNLNFITINNVNYLKQSSLFSEILVLLATLITLISWVFLSERYLFKNVFFVIYFLIFIVATINMVYSSNLLTMFIFFEFIFLPSLFFVYQFGYSKKVEKTILFLLSWTFTGSLLVLFGIAYLYGVYNTLDFNTLLVIKYTKFEFYFLFFLFFFGFGVKIPVWPFHYWLTKVHVEAPTGFSIFLSGYLVKTAFFCFTYYYYIFNNTVTNQILITFLIWGAIDASIRMWSIVDIKKLIAFATIQEMNLIMILFFFSTNNNYTFTNLFLLLHGVLSSLLFFLVDQVQKQTNTRNLTSLGGFANALPTLSIFIWISILIFRGFPIFAKFFVEWELLTVFYLNFNILGIIFFGLINILGVLGFVRIWFIVLYGQSSVPFKTSNILKKDFMIGIKIILILFILNFFIFLFNG